MSKLIYLDNSATSFPKPDVVYDFMNDFYRKHGVNPGRSGFDAAVETEEVVNSTRKMLTKLFNGGNDHNRLTFSYNATDSLNLIINGLVEKGIHVVSTMLEHNSVLRPLNMHHQNGTIDLTYVPFDEHGYVHPDDIKGMANAFKQIYSDPERKKVMIEKGQIFAKRFSEEKQAEEILNIYKKLMK